jgi:hypothetical protein
MNPTQVRAFNLYHSPLGDLELREQVLYKHLPHVPFVDHSPQQLPHDEEEDLTAEELSLGVRVEPAADSAAAAAAAAGEEQGSSSGGGAEGDALQHKYQQHQQDLQEREHSAEREYLDMDTAPPE